MTEGQELSRRLGPHWGTAGTKKGNFDRFTARVDLDLKASNHIHTSVARNSYNRFPEIDEAPVFI